MPRTVEITIPPYATDGMLVKIAACDGLIGLRVHRNISIKPPGDVIALEITNRHLDGLMRTLDEQGVLENGDYSVSTSQPGSIIAHPPATKITQDGSQTTWEETLLTINEQSRMTVNNMITMFLSGMIAVLGLVTNTIHVVVGASLVAPGFTAATRVSLGFISRHHTWQQGFRDIGTGYLSLLGGVLLTSYGLQWMGRDLTLGTSSYLPVGVLVEYFTTITVESLLISVSAAFIGALLILSNRTILTAGVMIVVALVTSAAIAGLALVAGDFSMAIQAFGRWCLEIVIIIGCSAIVFYIKKRTTMQRNMKI